MRTSRRRCHSEVVGCHGAGPLNREKTRRLVTRNDTDSMTCVSNSQYIELSIDFTHPEVLALERKKNRFNRSETG
jgi:hypothetical protein